MFGLSKGNANFSYGEIAFAIYLASAARLHVYEKGVFRGSFGGYAAGDRLRVSVTGGVVRYWRNGAVFYTSSVAPAYPLLVDTSLHTTGATVINATLSGNWSASGQAIVWTSAAGVSVSGNTLTKTSVNGWGNAGAVSTKSLGSGDGFVELTARETTTHRMLGLSKGNTNLAFGEIAFGLYLAAGATLHVYEKGAYRGGFGAYAAGDRLRVSVTGRVVRYSRNGIIFYTSTVAPAYPLLVDTALYTTGATLANVTVSARFQ
jgi:hypothetical protein